MKIPLRLFLPVLVGATGFLQAQSTVPSANSTLEEASPVPEAPIPLTEYSTVVKANPTADLKAARAANKPELIPLTAAIAQVQDALNKYRELNRRGGNLPDLDSAEFEFKVTRQVVVGAKLSLWILTIGGTHQRQEVNDLTFTYSAPKPTPAPKGIKAAPPPKTLEENLVNTIQQAALAAKNEFTWGKKTYTKQIKIHLEYGVDVKIEGGAQIPVYMLTVGPNASWDKNAVQSVTLTFGSSK